jgi:hypothetical protein
MGRVRRFRPDGGSRRGLDARIKSAHDEKGRYSVGWAGGQGLRRWLDEQRAAGFDPASHEFRVAGENVVGRDTHGHDDRAMASGSADGERPGSGKEVDMEITGELRVRLRAGRGGWVMGGRVALWSRVLRVDWLFPSVGTPPPIFVCFAAKALNGRGDWLGLTNWMWRDDVAGVYQQFVS